jgi:ABC-type glucose/galactose transport system permease subunit
MEGVFALIAAFFIWVAEVNWELRCIGVFVTTGLVIHAAKRMQIALGRKVLVAAIVIAILLSSTWRPIWTDFHASFPAVTGEAVLSRIIVVCALFAASVAG